jgi:hypothetical protein
MRSCAEFTETKFRQIRALIALGQLTTPRDSEVLLAAGSLGVSAPVPAEQRRALRARHDRQT